MAKSPTKKIKTTANPKSHSSLLSKLKRSENALQRSNRALTVISQANRALLLATDESLFLNKVCEIITQTPGYLLAWVGFAIHDKEKTVKPVAQAGFKVGYLEKIKVHWGDDIFGSGPTGRSIKSGKTQIANHTLTNPSYKPWRAFGKEYGFNSCISIPFTIHRKLKGALVIYSSYPDAFDKKEVELLSQLSKDIEFGLSVIRLRNQLAEKNKKLRKYTDELEQFVHIASHDLQEPLRLIASYLGLIQKRYVGKLDKEADEYIGFAISGANRLQNMIFDLLLYSRIGNKPAPLKKVNMNYVVDGVLGYLDEKIKASNALVTHEELPEIKANESQMFQLFLSLLDNAIKFRRNETPKIHIAAVKKGKEWQFSISDNGIGIDKQYFPVLFDLFKRLVSRDIPGTGIGLPICKKIIDHHRGKIWVESTLGKGSTFFFTIGT